MQLADDLRMKNEQHVSYGGLSGSEPGSASEPERRKRAELEGFPACGPCSVPATLQGPVTSAQQPSKAGMTVFPLYRREN